MTSTQAAEPEQPEKASVAITAVPEVPPRRSLTEAVLDDLSSWTVVAAAVALLYLVWVTLEILDKYVGDLPKVGA